MLLSPPTDESFVRVTMAARTSSILRDDPGEPRNFYVCFSNSDIMDNLPVKFASGSNSSVIV
jgi:hypothetical protein